MARINLILQGFVDINLETDENVNTKIGYKEIQAQSQLAFGAINLNLGGLSKKSVAAPNKIELPVSVEEIFEGIGINLLSVQSLHIQGSRLYGINDANSDWDLSLITTEVSENDFREVSIGGNDFDVHLFSQSNFQNRLDNHEMRELESLSHPEEFILIDNKSFSLDIDNNKLISQVNFESDDLWNRAKNTLNSGGDSYVALKNIWHSFRFLIFAEQILQNGNIVEFSAANYLYEPIINSKQTDFEYFVLNFSQLRDTLKSNLDTFKDDGGLEMVEFQL
jgi:hypothetical protein